MTTPADPLTELLRAHFPEARLSPAPPAEQLLRVAEVAERVGYSEKGLLRRLHRTNEIPVVRVGRLVMFKPSDVEELIVRLARPQELPWR